MKSRVTVDDKEPVLVMSRTFDAPRALVWAALTDPQQVAVWYGGDGFENPLCEMDVRPGGLWRHVMRTPDGAEHALCFVFLEVQPPERLVWRSARPDGAPLGAAIGGADGDDPHDNVMTVTLEEIPAPGGSGRAQTTWTLSTRFGSQAAREAAGRIGFTTVLDQGVQKLADLLRDLQARR